MADMPADDPSILFAQYEKPAYVVEAQASEAADIFVKSLGTEEEDLISNRVLGDNLHMTAIRDEGLRLGVTEGMNSRIEEINVMTEELSGYFDTIFSFNNLVHDNRVLVPSIGIAEQVFEQFNEDSQAEVVASFSVIEEAEMVSQVPTFRDYISFVPVEADGMYSELWPKTKDEERVLKESYRRGYMQGREQAEGMFYDGLYELHQDIIGRLTYKTLVSLNMIEPISVVKQDNGITYIDRTMNVGEEIYTIENTPNFTNSENWRVAWQVGEEFMSLRFNPFHKTDSGE